jgi:hypothetical protein
MDKQIKPMPGVVTLIFCIAYMTFLWPFLIFTGFIYFTIFIHIFVYWMATKPNAYTDTIE